MPRMVRLALPFAAVALVLGAAALGSDWEATGRPLPRAERVVVLGIPRLDWRDLDEGRAPALRRLALQKGAAGTLSARAAATVPEPVEGYATLGAGSRLKGIPEAASAVQRGGGVEVPAARALARKQRGRHLPTGPGALGDALHHAGIRTAVVGAGAAAVAAMDRTGRVDAGALGRVDLGAARGARFVVVDPGDIERVERFKDLEDPARTRAIRRADALAGRLAATLPPRTLLLVAAVSPAYAGHATPLIAVGAGRGRLGSPSTKRTGVSALTDLAPTVLAALGVKAPDDMTGHAIELEPGAATLDEFLALDRAARVQRLLYTPAVIAYILLQLALYWVVIGVVSLRRAPSRLGLLRWGALFVAALPLAGFLLRAIPDVASLGTGANGALIAAIAAALTALALVLGRPLMWILAATLAVLLADLATGTHLHRGALLGSSLAGGGRFYGTPNTTFALIGGAALLLAALRMQGARDRGIALADVGALFALVLIVDAAPMFGADVGGLLTFVPVFGLTWLVFAGRRLTVRTTVAAAAIGAVAVVAAAAVDLSRPEASRTHLGDFADKVLHDGPGEIFQTIARKEGANAHFVVVSLWTWLLPVIAALLLALLADRRRRDRLLPPGSALRVGALAVPAFAAVGFVTNDSGSIVLALSLVYLGPFLVLRALWPQAEGEPELPSEAPWPSVISSSTPS